MKSHSPNLGKNGLYRVQIGVRNFWLGRDKDTAVKLTKALDLAWENETNTINGKKCWSQKSIASAYAMVGLAPPAVQTPAPTINPVPLQSSPIGHLGTRPQKVFTPALHPREITFYQALQLYVQMRLNLQKVGEIRRAGEDSEEYINAIKHHLPDMQLHSIDAQVLLQLSDVLKSCPPHRKTGKPISIVTARKWLQELGSAFEYFSHPDSRIGWVPPYVTWREKFSITDKAAKNIALKLGDKDFGKVKPTYTLEQVAILYKAATSKEKFYLLGAICLGWTGIEFASLKREQIQESDGEMYITKERSKTGVETKFWICPELAQMVRVAAASTPPNAADLAFMTKNRRGQPMPLVHGKTNTISQAMERILNRVNMHQQKVPTYPHSSLRKLAGQLVENITGNHSLAQMLLSHKKADVASTNYIGQGVQVGVGKSPLERLWDAQREVHKAIQQYVINPPAKTEVDQSKNAA